MVDRYGLHHCKLIGDPNSLLRHSDVQAAASIGDAEALHTALDKLTEGGWLSKNLPLLWAAASDVDAILCCPSAITEATTIAQRLQVPAIVVSSLPTYPTARPGAYPTPASLDPAKLNFPASPRSRLQESGAAMHRRMRPVFEEFRKLLQLPTGSKFVVEGLPHVLAVPPYIAPVEVESDVVKLSGLWVPPITPGHAAMATAVGKLLDPARKAMYCRLQGLPITTDMRAATIKAIAAVAAEHHMQAVVEAEWRPHADLLARLSAATVAAPLPAAGDAAGDESKTAPAAADDPPASTPELPKLIFLPPGSTHLPSLLRASCGLLVHGGGTIATTSALAAGVAQLVCPSYGQQHFWASVVARLRVGEVAPAPVAQLPAWLPACVASALASSEAAGTLAEVVGVGVGEGHSKGVKEAAEIVARLLKETRFRNAGVQCVWLPDSARSSCAECRKPFNLLRRRHHCRSCGLLVCSACNKEKRLLPGFPVTEPQQVCLSCASERTGMILRRRSTTSINSQIARARSRTMSSDRPVEVSMEGSSVILGAQQVCSVERALPYELKGHKWVCKYRLSTDGAALSTLLRHCGDLPSSVCIIETTTGEKFGGFGCGKWVSSDHYTGTASSFVFSLQPNTSAGHVHVYTWAGRAAHKDEAVRAAANKYFMISSGEGLGMGGGEHFAFYIDAELLRGSTGYCATFHSPSLVSGGGSEVDPKAAPPARFDCLNVEVWGLQDSFSGDFR